MKRIIALSIILIVCMLCANAQEKEVKQKTISVTGTAEAEVVPDEIYVQVDLKEYDKRNVGKIDIETIKSNFLAACQNIGIAANDISVQSFGGNDNNYWQIKRKKKDPDLKATISYWVKLNTTSKMDELVDKLDDEATQNFFIAKTNYSKREELKKQMKISAIKAAKDKAVYLSDAINEHVGAAVTITDVDYESNVVNNVTGYTANNAKYYKNSNALYFNDITNEIGFGKIKFQFQVSVVFALQ